MSLCLAGRFPVRLMGRFLAGPSRTRMGRRPAFSCSDVPLCEVNSSSKSAHVQNNETSEGKAPHSFHRDHLLPDFRGFLSDFGRRVRLRQLDAWDPWSG